MLLEPKELGECLGLGALGVALHLDEGDPPGVRIGASKVFEVVVSICFRIGVRNVEAQLGTGGQDGTVRLFTLSTR